MRLNVAPLRHRGVFFIKMADLLDDPLQLLARSAYSTRRTPSGVSEGVISPVAITEQQSNTLERVM